MKNKDGEELDALDLREWLDYGIAQGWISEPTCYHHDPLPMTEQEVLEMEEWDDICLNVVRIWDV